MECDLWCILLFVVRCLCGFWLLCCIYIISQFTCCMVSQVECDLWCIHLIYDCDILLYIHTIHLCKVSIYNKWIVFVVYSVVYTLYHNSPVVLIISVSIYNKWIVICGVFCCIYIISQFTCCKVSIYNKWIVICGVFCCIYHIFVVYCCKVWIVICMLYIHYITFHLL